MPRRRSNRSWLGLAAAMLVGSLAVAALGFGAGVAVDRRAPTLIGPYYDQARATIQSLIHPRRHIGPGPSLAQMSTNNFEIQDPAGPLPGSVLLVLQGEIQNQVYPGRIVEVDRTGAVTWEYRPPQNGQIGDVRKLSNGDVLFEIHDLSPKIDGRAELGMVIEVDRSGHVVRQVTALVDHHAELLPSGNLLVVSAATDSVSELSPTGTTAWSWKSADHIKAYNASTYLGWNPNNNLQNLFSIGLSPQLDSGLKDNEAGWLHTNSAQRLTNGDTMISERNADTVVEVNEAGDILATYGGLIFKHQHCAFVIPAAGHLLVTDNGNGRVVEMDLATQHIVWKYDTGLLFPEQGCAYRLPGGDTLITDSSHRRVLEVNMAGQIEWQLVIKTPATSALYRASWVPPS